MTRLYNVRKKCKRTLDLTAKCRFTSCNVFLVTVHATLSVALAKCTKYTRNIGKVDYFQFFGCLCYTLETRSWLQMFFVNYPFMGYIFISYPRQINKISCGTN